MANKSEIVKEYFNNTDNYLKSNPEILLRTLLIKLNLPSIRNKKIIDVGCGNGELSLPFVNNNQITFVDFSEKMLEIVKLKIPYNFIGNTTLININIDQLDSNNKFDYIFAIGLLAHVESVESTFNSLSGLLAENGILVIQFTNRHNFSFKIISLLSKIKSFFRRSNNLNLNYTTISNINKNLINNNLLNTKKITFWPSSIPGLMVFPRSISNFIYFKILNSKLFRNYGSEVLYFIKKKSNS